MDAPVSTYASLLFRVRLLIHEIQRPKNQKKNAINYHLSRMYPKLVGPHKRQ